jgi:hypothetical protein
VLPVIALIGHAPHSTGLAILRAVKVETPSTIP